METRGGGISNLVGGEDGLTVATTTSKESIEVTPGGVNYVVTNVWSGCFFTYDIPPGIYRVDLNGTKAVLSSVKVNDSFSRNTYYSDKTGVDIYSSTVYSGEIILSEDGKIGFVLPQGEGVAHPSIVRIL